MVARYPDCRGVQVEAPGAEALESLEQVITSLVSFRGDPLALVKQTLSEWPDFSLAHVLRALVLLGFTERRFVAAARKSIDRAAELMQFDRHDLPHVPQTREQTLLLAARQMVEQEWGVASELFERLLLDNPLDMLSLHMAHSLDFFQGNVWNLRNRINRVLPFWQPTTPGYPQVLGMHAFGLEECNHYPQAEQAARTSLDLEPRNPWAVHALTHVFEMQGRVFEGIQHLQSRMADWATDSGFAYHIWWHLALFYLDQDDETKVLRLYDEQFAQPEARYALNMIDAAALLWRLQLFGIDTGNRAGDVADWWRSQLDDGAGCYAFNDFHAAVAFLAAGDLDALTLLARQTGADRALSEVNRQMLEQTARPLVQALAAYAEGSFQSAARQLAELRDAAQSFGGSHAQRDLITLTLIDAAARSGQKQLAQHYLNERLVMKPQSRLGARLEQQLDSLPPGV